ncbi:hypothetical protein FA13DRAFT_440544 [Coprinellus micaceus]|uniref:Uncharacterized protein n=1 Tax=Coprinellus micaceus TaxID=71717 RepID=A0A4Y7TZ29_COPMI|nr:hypothetical protein FA13DRAFT_440544 [Coprinellus micaceus]
MKTMQLLHSTMPLWLLLLVLQVAMEASATPSHSTSQSRALPRLVRRAHDSAVRKTHSLARDLRVALGSVLPRAEPQESNGRVVYCKPGKQQVLTPPNNGNGGGGDGEGSGGGNGTSAAGGSSTRGGSGSSTRQGASTRTRSSSSQPTNTPATDSPWSLVDDHRGNSFFQGWDFFTSADPTHGERPSGQIHST